MMLDVKYVSKLKALQGDVGKKYELELEAERNPERWKLILECLTLVIEFVIQTGLKVKWYNPIVIYNALRLIKKIVGLVVSYLKEKN